MSSRSKRWVQVIFAMILVAPFGIALSYPFLAVTDPSGAHTVVVEGWIPEDSMPDVKAEIERGGYTHVYTTGTTRNLSYTLHQHDTIAIDLIAPSVGTLIISACGSTGAGFRLITDRDILLTTTVPATCVDHVVQLNAPVERIRLISVDEGMPDPHAKNLFILYMKLDGRNVHELLRSISIHRADGTIDPGSPTFAEAAAAYLRSAGVKADMINALPSAEADNSRTWANAQRFAEEARSEKITEVDVISFGVHALRSRTMYRKACGPAVRVGVISLVDPEMRPGIWWHRRKGWYIVAREMAGLPASHFLKEDT